MQPNQTSLQKTAWLAWLGLARFLYSCQAIDVKAEMNKKEHNKEC